MGTRSLTVFVDEHSKKEIVVMYRQYDGYIDYYGRKLHDYLFTFDGVVNGIKDGDYVKRTANGMSCLAAQTIMHMKSEIENRDYNNRVFNPDTGHMEAALQEGNHCGGIYLYPAGTRDCGEEYIYIVKCRGKGIHLAAWKPETPDGRSGSNPIDERCRRPRIRPALRTSGAARTSRRPSIHSKSS